MSLHLDTSSLVGYLRGDEQIRRKMRGLALTPSVSAIALGELLHGARVSNRKSENESRVYTAISEFSLIDFDRKCAVAYADVRTALRLAGRPCGEADIAIAVTAIAYGSSLVTLDRKHFEPIAGLTLEDWNT